MIFSSSLFCQDKCNDIDKFYCDYYYFVQKKKEKKAYCIHYQDTIAGNKIKEDQYGFFIGNDTCIVVHLTRKWNIFNPLWNTTILSDTISLLPIGTINYIFHDDTLQQEGFKSSYVGPKLVSLKNKGKGKIKR